MRPLDEAFMIGVKLAYTSTFYQDPSTPKSQPPTSILPVVSKTDDSIHGGSVPSGSPGSNMPKFAQQVKRAAETLTIPGMTSTLKSPPLTLPDPLIVDSDKGNLASSMVQARAAKKKLQGIANKMR